MRRASYLVPIVLAGSLVVGCTSSTDSTGTDTTASLVETTVAPVATTGAGAVIDRLDAVVQPGSEQVAVLDAEPGAQLQLVGESLSLDGTVDTQGSLLWRDVAPGTYRIETGDGSAASDPVEVMALDDVPPASFYESQDLEEGFGYLTARDGTTLSVNVVLPGPVEAGPYPTVVEYSGYDPSNPDNTTFAQLYTGLGFAYVGVNIRGTGCSGGSFEYFEPVQSLDGYDAIEIVAAQPWVRDGRVGMVGISYPGISQLFVARTQPPHLAAITPLSVLDDSYRATLYPGGILNTGFAVAWTAERQAQAEPYGQGWTQTRAEDGDETCADNQQLRLQNPDLLQSIEDHPFYDAAVHDQISPTLFVDRIEVPVFLAGAWQDEQTGGHFPEFLDRFIAAPHLYATLVNGLHTESLSLSILTEYIEFLHLYVAHQAPDLSAASLAAPLLASGVTGVFGLSLPPSQLQGLSYEDALAAFEARPPVRVLFEEGAADGTAPGSPVARFEARFPSWPIPSAEPTSWYFTADGILSEAAPTVDAPAESYVADPDAVPATWYDGGSSSSDIWRADVVYDWQRLPDANSAVWTSAAFAEDVAVVGSGTAVLQLRSSAQDTDLEVTISELRPDGTEMYVQSGWLRASRRAIDGDRSTASRTVLLNDEASAAPLPTDAFTEVRVPIFPVGHVFRAGSQLRVTIGAPGGNRPVWVFDTLSDGETNEIGQSPALMSHLVLPVVPEVEAPPGVAACGSLRGQPCRPSVG